MRMETGGEPMRSPSHRMLRIAFATVALASLVLGLQVGGSASAVPMDLEAGRIPADAIRSDGSTDLAKVPDLVTALDRDGNEVGFVRKADLFGENLGQAPTDRPIEVITATGRLVGHLVPDFGFVRLGQVAEDSDTVTVVTYLIPAESDSQSK
jgi:hypothetical protein